MRLRLISMEKLAPLDILKEYPVVPRVEELFEGDGEYDWVVKDVKYGREIVTLYVAPKYKGKKYGPASIEINDEDLRRYGFR